MNSLILRSFVDFVKDPMSLAGLVCLAFAFALMCSARNITRAIRKRKDVESNDKAFIVTFTFGIILLCVGIILVVLSTTSL